MSRMEPVLRAKALFKAYSLGHAVLQVLEDISLEVTPGEMVAIGGRSGSGKSTLLHTLASLQRPDSGTVTIGDVEMTRLPEEEMKKVRSRMVGFVYQAFNLLPQETTLRNVELPLLRQGLNRWDSREKAEAALQAVGLGNRAGHMPGQLSERQRQSMAIARALAHDPAVVFVDDPTRDLDSTSQEELMGMLQELNGAGRTIVIATPDPAVARCCHRVLWIESGLLRDRGQVSARRIIPRSRSGSRPMPPGTREVMVCPRCNYGNFQDDSLCLRCRSPLQLSAEEQKALEGRVSGTDERRQAPESPTGRGEASVAGLVAELKALPLFSGLGSADLTRLAPALHTQEFKKGSAIVKQGDTGDAFYILRSGKVQVLLQRGGGPSVLVAELGPNEGFGEMALLTGSARSATIVASTDVQVWRLAKAAFDSLVSENLSLALYFNRVLSQRLQALQERIVP